SPTITSWNTSSSAPHRTRNASGPPAGSAGNVSMNVPSPHSSPMRADRRSRNLKTMRTATARSCSHCPRCRQADH
ncbi:hypothetical protein DD702_09565, partial [Bifidobacterium animalis subsp. lactis]